MIYIYKHRNNINGKVYIGQTNNPTKRWTISRYKDSPRFYNAIQKYGWENFTHEILSTIENQTEADNQEIALIEYFDSTNPEKGYNISIGGNAPTRGRHHSDETKKKISVSNKGRCSGEKNYMYGKHHTKDIREKISKNRNVLSGKNHPCYGKKLSDEHKENISKSRIGKYSGENGSFYGRHHSEESKKKMSETKKGVNNPLYGKHHSEDTKKKMSENSKSNKPVYLIDTIEGWDEYYESVVELNKKYSDWVYKTLTKAARNGTLYKNRYKIEYAN